MTYGQTSVWTPEATALFEQLFARKLSFGDISFELKKLGYNINRNACIGKARRMKISNGRVPGNNAGDRPSKYKDQTERLRAAHERTKERRKAMIKCEPAVIEQPLNNRSGDLIDLDAAQCRYPVTGGFPPFKFCTRDHRSGSPYCAEHHARCFTPATARL